MIRKFKFFFRPISDLKKWLNKMSDKGYRLKKTGSIFYYFEQCEKGKYIYDVDFVANKSYSELKNYEIFLEESNIKYIEKAASVGKLAIGNVRWRPYADKAARVATSNGMIKRELLILEKENNGKDFAINTTIKDKINSLKIMRRPTISMIVFTGAMLLLTNGDLINKYKWSLFEIDLFTNISNPIIMGILVIVEILLFINLIKFNIEIKKLKKESDIYE